MATTTRTARSGQSNISTDETIPTGVNAANGTNGNSVPTTEVNPVVAAYRARIAEMKEATKGGGTREERIAAETTKILAELATLDTELTTLTDAKDKLANFKSAAKLLSKLDKLEIRGSASPEEIQAGKDRMKAARDKGKKVAELRAMSEENRAAALAAMTEADRKTYTESLARERKPRAKKGEAAAETPTV